MGNEVLYYKREKKNSLHERFGCCMMIHDSHVLLLLKKKEKKANEIDVITQDLRFPLYFLDFLPFHPLILPIQLQVCDV
jgi:hypothetical protein